MFVSRPMVASPRAYRSDHGQGRRVPSTPTIRVQHRQGDGRCRRSEEPLRPHRLPDGRQEAIEGMARNGQNPGRCRGSVNGVRPSLVVPLPGPSRPSRDSTCQASPRRATSRGQTGPEGSSTPASCSHGTPPHSGLRRSRLTMHQGHQPTGMVTVMPAMCSSEDGLVSTSSGSQRRKTTARRPRNESAVSPSPPVARDRFNLSQTWNRPRTRSGHYWTLKKEHRHRDFGRRKAASC